jgi:type II secretory pathway component GspD/PulD (secretin)
MDNVSAGLNAVLGGTRAPIIDRSTRTIVYEATHRTAELAERYFQRMRSSTALIIFETYIWEVGLNTGNSTGIRWDMIDTFGKFAANIDLNGDVGADFSNPISIGLPTTQGADGGTFTPNDVLKFLSTFGAVKTISQPQITVLSGSQAKLRAADKQNYVARVAETIDNGQSTTSVETSSVDTGFTVTINSAWDNATVYADIEIALTDVSDIEDFDFTSGNGGQTTVQLPKTTERELKTQVRIRPGDSLLIAGLVRESDSFDESGPGGSMKPILPVSRTATASNLELVFLLRPRVIVFTSPTEEEHFNTIRAAATPPQAAVINSQPVVPLYIAPQSDAVLPPDAPAHMPARAGAISSPVSYEAPASAPAKSGAYEFEPLMGSVPIDLLNPGAAGAQ